jgi:hypothetical protein
MDNIELNDFATELDAAALGMADRKNDRVRYSGHLLLPGDDVIIALNANRELEIKIGGLPASTDHDLVELVEEHRSEIRRALTRKITKDVSRVEIIGRWHENGDEYALEPYLLRTVYRDKPDVLHKYRFRIFPLDDYNLGNDFSVEFTSAVVGHKVKAVLENSTERHIHYDELPKSMFEWMPVGVVWTPPARSGFPVLVEYAVGKEKRLEMRSREAA